MTKKPRCEVCKGPLKLVWESKDKTTVGLKCVKGHYPPRDPDKHYSKRPEREWPVFLVPRKELEGYALD